MCTNVSVVCPSVVYASMLSELICCPDIQEGFLLGSSTDHTRTQITDADMGAQTSHTTRHISSYLPMDGLGEMYSASGAVRDDTLARVTEFAHANHLSVVGWYRWRSCGDPWERVFLRERLVHKQLQQTFCADHGFLLLLLNTRREGPDLLPSTTHLLQCLNDAGDLVRLPLQLSNLGNTSSSDYKLEPGNPALYTSSVLAPVLQQRLQCLEPGVQESKELHASLEHLLQEQLSLLSEAQVQRSKKVQQLQMLRSICHQNGIIPDIEWPSRLGLKKKKESAAKKPHDNTSKPVPSQEAPLDITNAVVAAAAQVVGTKNGSQSITTRRNPNKRAKLKPHSKASTATPAIDATKSATEEPATIADPSLQADNDGDNNAIDGLQKSLTRLAVKNGIGNKNGSTKSSPLRPASRGSRGSPSKSRSPAPRSITPRTGNSPAPRCSPRPKPRPGSACKVSTGTQSMPETVTEENPATNSLGPETNSPLEPAAKAKRRLDSGSPSKSSRSSSESPVKQAWRS